LHIWRFVGRYPELDADASIGVAETESGGVVHIAHQSCVFSEPQGVFRYKGPVGLLFFGAFVWMAPMNLTNENPAAAIPDIV
jgi:hypothetical protein